MVLSVIKMTIYFQILGLFLHLPVELLSRLPSLMRRTFLAVCQGSGDSKQTKNSCLRIGRSFHGCPFSYCKDDRLALPDRELTSVT
jgi:hypothetical protein